MTFDKLARVYNVTAPHHSQIGASGHHVILPGSPAAERALPALALLSAARGQLLTLIQVNIETLPTNYNTTKPEFRPIAHCPVFIFSYQVRDAAVSLGVATLRQEDVIKEDVRVRGLGGPARFMTADQ